MLLVGTGERMKDALEDALERHAMMVESVSVERVAEAAFAAAPDLLVLIGDATADGGRAVLARLGESPATATVPVVLLADEAALDRRLDAFRHGVVAIVPKSASADGMARRVAEVARELPERHGETAGELGEASVDELVELFSQQLRTGILSVTAEGGEGASAQVVLRAGRPVTEAIEELVTRLRPLVSDGGAGALRYEFHESTSARLTLLDPDETEPEDGAILEGRRILLIERNPARADVLVQELRARGALVVVADGEGAGLDRARAMDPEVVVLDGSGVHGWALATLRALRRDPRLRWASLLVVEAADLWPAKDGGPNIERLAASLKPLVRADRELAERALREPVFDTRLEVIGPSRVLRALTGTGAGLRLSIQHPRARIEVDLAEGLVAGAKAVASGGGATMAEGPGALAALLALGSGRLHVERKDAPASANVMAPVDDALAAAGREVAPIKPSIPPPAGTSDPPRAEPARPQDSERLIGRLEELLERLQKVLPPEVAQEPPAGSRPAVPKPAKAIPPPRRELPPARPRQKTLPLGTLKPKKKKYESQDDLPVIEATAEPTMPVAPVPAAPSAPAPVPPPFEAAPPSVVIESAPVIAIGAPSAPAPESVPSVIVESMPGVEPAPASSAPAHVVPTPLPAADVFAPSAPLPRHLAEHEPPRLPKSRGLLWFGLAFVVTLVIAGGAAAAYLYVRSGGGDEVRTLPVTSESGQPVAVAPGTGAPDVAPPAADAGVPAAVVAALPDAGPPSPPDAGPPGAGPAEERAADAGRAPDEPAPSEEGEAVSDEAVPDQALSDQALSDEVAPDEESRDARGDAIRHAIRVANFQRNAGNLGEAEASYMRVLRLDPNNARALAGLTRLNIARGNSGAAVRWARRLLATNPQNASNHVLLGDALERSGNRRAAVQSWQRALELSPGLRSARQRLGP